MGEIMNYDELKRLAESGGPNDMIDIDPDDILAVIAERDQLKAENEALKDAIDTDEKLIVELERLLDLFVCPAHGRCVPNAIEQVTRLKSAAKTLELLGYTDNGGELWKPPIGTPPNFPVTGDGSSGYDGANYLDKGE